LNHRSGLAGLAGTPDMREVLRRSEAGDADAELALAVYVHRLRGHIGAMAAAVGGLDALVFTGGVGERAPVVRARTTAGLGFLGLDVDPRLNDAATQDADVSTDGARARCLVVAAREDVQIAAEVRAVLG
ncbi:MAG TPA: acetate/propionate family kinase, partial [Actinopolymorphaceae bacterium]